MTIKEQLSSNIVAHWDFRKGTVKDQSGNNINCSFNGSPYFSETAGGKGLFFDGSDDYLDTGSTLQNAFAGSFTVNLWIRPQDGHPSVLEVFMGSRNALQEDWIYIELLDTGAVDFYYESDNAGALARTNSAVFEDGKNNRCKMITCVGDSTVNGIGGLKIYIDGEEVTLAVGSEGDTTGIVFSNWASSDNIYIGGFNAAGVISNLFNGWIREIIIFNTALSSHQISQLYEESLNEPYINRIADKSKNPQLLSYGEFERDLVWTKGDGWSIANGKASCDGSQLADSDLTQDVGEVGKFYTIQYSVSNYSAGNITALAGTTEGTDRSADGVYTEGLTAAGSGLLGLRADVNFIGDIDWIRISEGSELSYYTNGKDWNVSSGDVTSGFLENTGWEIQSGTWQVDDSSDGNKQITCIADGQILINSSVAFGQWEFDFYKSDLTVPTIMFIADSKSSPTDSSQDGYALTFSATEGVTLFEINAGVAGVAMITGADGTLTADSWNTIKITRMNSGLFEVFINGTSLGTATDLTNTSSVYFNIDLDVGDAIRNLRFKQVIN
jgi:hypothetical protein